MVIRAPIEKWSRPQLEDNYHLAIGQIQKLQEAIKEKDKKLTMFNAKMRRTMMNRQFQDDNFIEKDKYDRLVKDHELVVMKLKTAKHQLLLYTAPSARAATANLITGRSTFRAVSSRRRQPMSDTSQRTEQYSPKMIASTDKLQLSTDEKVMIVRLNRTLKSRNEEIFGLQRTVSDLQKRLRDVANQENNEKTTPEKKKRKKEKEEEEEKKSESELESLSEFSESSESSKSVASIDEPKKKRKSEKPRGRGDDRAPSVPRSTMPPVTLPPTLAAEPDAAVEIAERRCKQLSESLDNMMREYEYLKKQHDLINDVNGSLRREIASLNDTISKLKQSEKKLEKEKKKEKKREEKKEKEYYVRRFDERDEQANEEFEQKIDLLEDGLHEMRQDVDHLITTIMKRKKETEKEKEPGEEPILQIVKKWEESYTSLNLELEKVQKLLLIKQEITEKQDEELILLKDELERITILMDDKMSQAAKKLDEKQKKLLLLEDQIRQMSTEGQGLRTVLEKTVDEPASPRNSCTELSLRITKVKPSKNLSSSFFLSFEFFDFHLETTSVLRPKEQKLDFTTIYDIILSNLFLHYVKTHGITVEMYRPSGTSYQHLATGVISLKKLMGTKSASRCSGGISLISLDSGDSLCEVSFELAITQGLSTLDDINTTTNVVLSEPEEFEKLVVEVERCSGITEKEDEQLFIVYDLLNFSPFITDYLKNGYIGSKRVWMIPKSNETMKIMSEARFSVYLGKNSNGKEEVLATVQLPLLELIKQNTVIRGAFPLLTRTGKETNIKVHLNIFWEQIGPVSSPPAETPIYRSIIDDGKPITPQEPIPEPTVKEATPESSSQSESVSSNGSSDVLSPVEPPEIIPKIWEPDEDDVRSMGIVKDEEVEEVSARSSNPEDDSEERIPSSSASTVTELTPRENYQKELEPAPESTRSSADLSSLANLPPIAKPRKSVPLEPEESVDQKDTKLVFKEPLHFSIPPSEASSTSTPRRAEKPPVPLPEFRGRRAISTPRAAVVFEDFNIGEDYVKINVERMELIKYSKLFDVYYQEVPVYIDWLFLDYPVEMSRTSRFVLPAAPNEQLIIDCEKEYTLTKTRVKLLEQWIELGNRVDFTLVAVVDGQEEELAVAQLALFKDFTESLKTVVIAFYDIHGEALAELLVSIQFGEQIFD